MKNDKEKFSTALTEMEKSREVQKMKRFPQHRNSTTYQHSENVARVSFFLAEKLRWKIDEKEMARGAMLHDFYLYGTNDAGVSKLSHWLFHPRRALRNAEKYFKINRKERNIILSHMFPLTFWAIPHSKEALLVSMADKYCAFLEGACGEAKVEPEEGARLLRRPFRHPALS